MFSNSAKYALKASLYLAIHSSESKKVKIKDIADPINVPKAYIAKILQELSRLNLVSSAKGPYGGFYLNSENKNVTLTQIIDAVDGDERMNSCLLGIKECDKDNPCPLHHLAYQEKQLIKEKLNKTTLNELAQHVIIGKSSLPI